MVVSDVVNRFIDYGAHCGIHDSSEENYYQEEDSTLLRQLKYFYKKDLEKKFCNENLYIKAYYLHHLLDFFRETRVYIYDMENVFKEFCAKKIITTLVLNKGEIVTFKEELEEIFTLFRKNKEELYEDLKGTYSLESTE